MQSSIQRPIKNTEQKNQNSYETDRELKAYIYQQLAGIQPYLVADSQVAVLVEQAKPESKEFIVTLVATVDQGRMEADGQDADIYEAFSKAKDKMVQQLVELQNSTMDSAEREVEVQTALSGGFTIH